MEKYGKYTNETAMFMGCTYKNSDEGLIQLSSKGLMRLTFKTGKITSTYFMIRRAENVF